MHCISDENKKDSLRVIKCVTAAPPRRWSDRYARASRIFLAGLPGVLFLIGQGGKFNGISTKSGTNYLAVRAPTIPLISLVKSSVHPILRSSDDFL